MLLLKIHTHLRFTDFKMVSKLKLPSDVVENLVVACVGDSKIWYQRNNQIF